MSMTTKIAILPLKILAMMMLAMLKSKKGEEWFVQGGQSVRQSTIARF